MRHDGEFGTISAFFEAADRRCAQEERFELKTVKGAERKRLEERLPVIKFEGQVEGFESQVDVFSSLRSPVRCDASD